MKKILFIKNTVILTLSSLFLRLLGMLLRIYISKQIGAEALGLYQLIFSVHIFGLTLATAGFSVTVTRLIAENKYVGVMKKALMLSIFASTAAAAILYFGGGVIATVWTRDLRTLLPIQIFAIALPFTGVSCCFSGYFLARKKAAVIAGSQIFEQLIRIGLTIILIKNVQTIETACVAVVIADVVSEIVASIYLAVMYILDLRTQKTCNGKQLSLFSFLRICLPVGGTSYIASFLRMTENLIIPQSLVKSGLTKVASLELFGTIKGIVLPIIFFPSAFLSAVSSLLIPEISQMQNKKKIEETISTVLQITIYLSVFIANIMYLFAYEIGEIAGAAEAGKIIRILSVITPLMYVEGIVDGILKGLDMQMHTFKTGTADSVLRIAAILILVPLWGFKGLITVMICSNVATSLMSITVLPCKMRIKWVAKPVFAAAVASFAAGKISNPVAGIIVCSIVYFFITYILMPKKIKESV